MLPASKFSPPGCSLPRDGPHGPSPPDQTSSACSKFSHLLKRNKTWGTSGYRVLALNQQVMDMLVRRSQMNWPDNSQGLVFPNSLGHIWQRGYATKELRRVLDPAGLSWVTFHTFRKTVATRLDEAGLTAREIADQLGHEQPSMTTDVYMGAKLFPKRLSIHFHGDNSGLSSRKCV
ncbi:tyrosine-type recombinase/integrase [Corynebacterium striatum]